MRSAILRLLNIRQHARRLYWSVRLGTRIPRDVRIAQTARFQLCPDGWRLGGTIRIGRRVRISDGAILAPYGGSIVLEDGAYVGPYCVLYGHGGIHIGRGTLLAPHCVLVAGNHRFDDLDRPIAQQGDDARGITIGADVWIGAGARVLDGVTLGDGCVIGAGAVVTDSIEPNSVAVGVPARVVRMRGAKPNCGAAVQTES